MSKEILSFRDVLTQCLQQSHPLQLEPHLHDEQEHSVAMVAAVIAVVLGCGGFVCLLLVCVGLVKAQ